MEKISNNNLKSQSNIEKEIQALPNVNRVFPKVRSDGRSSPKENDGRRTFSLCTSE